MSDIPPQYRKPLGGVLLAIGVILLAYAFVRMNSFEYQFGGDRKQMIVYFSVGIPSSLIGICLLLMKSDTEN